MAIRNFIEIIASAIDRSSMVFDKISGSARRMEHEVTAAARGMGAAQTTTSFDEFAQAVTAAQEKIRRGVKLTEADMNALGEAAARQARRIRENLSSRGILSDPTEFNKLAAMQDALLAKVGAKSPIRIRITTADSIEQLRKLEAEIDKTVVKGKAAGDKHQQWISTFGTRVRQTFGDTFVGSVFGALAGGIAFQAIFAVQNAILGIGAAFYAATQRAEDLNRAVLRTGLSLEAVQAVEFAAKQVGVGFNTITAGMRTLARVMAEDISIFAALGVATRDANGNLKSTESVLIELADLFANSRDETAKMALGLKLFGRAGTDILPVLELGSAGIKKWADAARDAGIVLDAATTTQLAELNDQLDVMKARWDGFTLRVRLAIIPEVVNFLDDEIDKTVQHRSELITQIAKERAQAQGTSMWSGGADEYRAIAEIANQMLLLEQIIKGVEKSGSDMIAVFDRAAPDDNIISRWKEHQKAVEKTEAEASKFETTLAAIEKKLASRAFSSAQIDEMALAFGRAEVSLRGILTVMHGDEQATLNLVERSKVLVGLQKEYGDSWLGVSLMFDQAARSSGTMEQKMLAVKDAMIKVLEVAQERADKEDQINAKLEEQTLLESKLRNFKKGTLDLKPDDRLPDVPPPTATIRAPGGMAGVFDFINELDNTATAIGDTLGNIFKRMVSSLDTAIGRMTEKLKIFSGVVGGFFKIVIDEILKQLLRLALAKLFTFIAGLFLGPVGAALGGNVGGATGGASNAAIAGARPSVTPGRDAVNAASRQVNVTIQAIDSKSIADRHREARGSFRLYHDYQDEVANYG